MGNQLSYYILRAYVLLIKSHLQSYPCPLNINYFWNQGFFLGMTIVLQILTGILLALRYTSEISSAYYSVIHIIREIYYGWCLRYVHSSGASLVFMGYVLPWGQMSFWGATVITNLLSPFPCLIEW